MPCHELDDQHWLEEHGYFDDEEPQPQTQEEYDEYLSNCCGASYNHDTLMCNNCKEYCEPTTNKQEEENIPNDYIPFQ